MRSDKTLIALGISFTLLMTQAAFAVQGEGDPITYQNPRTHGEMQPRLSGKLNQIRLRTPEGTATWLGQVHSTRGAIQLWGNGALGWTDESLADMDGQLRQLVDMNYDAFKVRSKDLMMSKSRTTYSGPFRTIVYDRYFWMEDAVRFPVEKAYVAFRFKFGRLVQITNYSFGEVGIIEAPVVSADEAVAAASDDVMLKQDIDRVNSKVGIELAPFFIKGGDVRFRLVYKVSVEKKRPNGVWNYSVNAGDGSIVEVKSDRMTSEVMGDIKKRLPSDEVLTVPMAFAKVKGRGGEESANESGEFGMDPVGAMGFLQNTFVTPKRSGKIAQMSPNQDGNIHFQARDSFDESNVFFHITRVNNFVQQFIQAPFLKKAITVNTRVTGEEISECNAWYSPRSKDLNFLPESEKCSNTAHISDVVYHEWGHALDDALGGIQDGAFSEGLGDVTSFIMTGDSKLAPEFFRGDSRPIRDANVVKVYPRDRNRNPHVEGLIISGAWFETMQAMKSIYGDEEGRTKTANIFFKHLVSTDSYLDSYAGALVIDDDDGDLSNCTPHMCVLNTAFAKRGLTSADDRCRQANACGSTTIIR